MLKGIHFHKKVSGKDLDDYLARGWYRIGQFIFTTDYVPLVDQVYRVFWLRYHLRKYSFGAKQLRLMKAGSKFGVSIRPFVMNKEAEDLYQLYLTAIDFQVSPNLYSNLFEFSPIEDPGHNVFDSQVIELRDEGKLIAAGIFDSGSNSIAGILNFYDPSYKKYSLGKYLMLLKLQFAIEQGMEFYYPGYIAIGNTKFDYKLFPGKSAAEIYDPNSQQWHLYDISLMQSLKNSPPYFEPR